MARRKISKACAKCGKTVAATLLFCAACVNAAMPAQAKPSKAAIQSRPVEASSAWQRSHTLAELAAMGQLPPASRPDDRDMPEQDATFYTPEIFAAGTASPSDLHRMNRVRWYPNYGS